MTPWFQEVERVRAFAKNFFPLLGYLSLQPIALVGYVLSAVFPQAAYAYHANPSIADATGKLSRVMTSNVCGLPGGLPYCFGKKPPARFRAREIVEFIRQEKPQVLCLQEVWDTELRDILVQELTKIYPHIYSKIGGSRWGFDSGLFVASSFSVQDIEYIPFHNNGSWPDRVIHRGAFIFKVGGHKFGVTHMQPGQKNRAVRTEQAAQIPKDCQVIMGDLNTRGDETPEEFFPGFVNRYAGPNTSGIKDMNRDYVLTQDGFPGAQIRNIEVEYSDHQVLFAEFGH